MEGRTILQTAPRDFPEMEVATRGPSPWRRALRNPLGVFGIVTICVVVAFSFAGPLVYHASAYAPHLLHITSPPSIEFPLGTDGVGRDELARLMLGGQASLEVGFAAAFLAMVFGTMYGMTSAYMGGWTDVVMMRVVDVALAVPSLFLLLFLDSVFRPSVLLMIFIFGCTGWFGTARLIRGEVLSLRRRDYVEASIASGARPLRVMVKVILPNLLGILLVSLTFAVGDGIVAVAGLSFLGLGLPPPAPNWGGMLSDSMTYVYQNLWWLIFPPGVMILLCELSVNFVGDALRVGFDNRVNLRR